jgi:predicted neuraminidase
MALAGMAGAGEGALMDQTFRTPGLFEWRTAFPETAERRWSWVFSAAETADGRIIMVWCSSGGAEVSTSNRILYSYSADDGKTWCEPLLLADSKPDAVVVNPVCYAHPDGRLLVFYNVCLGLDNVYAAKGNPGAPIVCRLSDDSGRTWSAPRPVPINPAAHVTGLLSPPLRLTDGTILLPTYYGTVENSRSYAGTVMRSRDRGETWQQGGKFHVPDSSIGAAEPSIAQLSNGDLLCLLRTTCGWQYECRSTDGGLTWSVPRPSVFASPNACAILRRLASGRLIFVWDNSGTTTRRPRYPLCVAVSDDDGATWPRSRMLDTESGQNQLSNHGVFQTKAGTILVMLCRLQYPGERGPIEVARFDEAWLLSGLDPELWEERRDPTGGTRLEAEGLLLASGADGAVTDVVCRRALSADCDIECGVVRAGGSEGAAGVFIQNGPQERAQFTVGSGSQPTTLRVRIRGGRAVAVSPGGPDQAAGSNAMALSPASQWGLFVRGSGAQARYRFAYVRVLPNQEPP